MSKDYTLYLNHILGECNYISNVISKMSFEEFIEDETLKRAIIRSLEIIGEATKKIPIDIKLKWANIQWKSMAGMRDRLIHDYLGVNYIIVWDVVKNKIPEIKNEIEFILSNKINS